MPSKRSNRFLVLAVYMLSSGCWLPGDDRHPDERGCQSNSSGASSGESAPTAYDFTHPRLSYAEGTFRAVAQANGHLWGFDIPANPQVSITGPHELSVKGTLPVIASIGEKTAVAWRDGARIGFVILEEQSWATAGAKQSFDAEVDHHFLCSDGVSFFLLWAGRGDGEEGRPTQWRQISAAGDVLASGALTLEGVPTGMVALDGGFFVAWTAAETERAGLSGVIAGGEAVAITLPRFGVLSAPALHGGAIVVALQSSEGQSWLMELDPNDLEVGERELDTDLPVIAQMGSTDRGLLILGTSAEQDSIVGYLGADGTLESATALPFAQNQSLASGASLGFSVLQEAGGLAGYWTMNEETISTPIILAENYTEGCQVGGRSSSTGSSVAAFLLALLFASRSRQNRSRAGSAR